MNCGECLVNRVEIVPLVNGLCPKCKADYRTGDEPEPEPTRAELAAYLLIDAEYARKQLKIAARDIAGLVKPYGFTEVVFTGLGPTLKRGEIFVEVPY